MFTHACFHIPLSVSSHVACRSRHGGMRIFAQSIAATIRFGWIYNASEWPKWRARLSHVGHDR